MPNLIYTIQYKNDLSSLKKEAKETEKILDKIHSGSGAKQATTETKQQEQALKDLRKELRRKISLVDADLRLGNKTQEQAEKSISQIKQWAEAQGAFNREQLIGAQNLKTFANAQTRAQTGFKGVSHVANRANQVLFDFNQGLQDLPFGMRGVGNNIPFVINGFRMFGQAAIKAGVNPVKAFLRVMASPAGLIGTAAAVIPTLILFAQQFNLFGDSASEASEKIDTLNSELKETTDILHGVTDQQLMGRVNEQLLDRINLEERLTQTRRDLGLQTSVLQRGSGFLSAGDISMIRAQTNAISDTNTELSEQATFIRELSAAEQKALRKKIEELREEASTRKNLNELIDMTLTGRERELRAIKEQTDNVLDDYRLKISGTSEELKAHRDRLEEVADDQRNMARAIKEARSQMEQGTPAWEKQGEVLDAYRQRLKDTEDQLKRVNDELDKARRPDVPLSLPEDAEITEDPLNLDIGTAAMLKQQEQHIKLIEMRRDFARDMERMDQQLTQARLAGQATLAEQRVQIEQQAVNEMAAINRSFFASEMDREQAIMEARKQFAQNTIQIERQAAQQRLQIEQQLGQARIQAQQLVLNAFSSLSHGFAKDNKKLALQLLVVEKGLAMAQAAKEGAEKAGRAQMIASYYLAQAITPVGPNPAAIAAASNAQAQVAAIKGTTFATIAAIAATGLGEAATIMNRGSRTSGTGVGGATGTQQGFNTFESPTNFAAAGNDGPIIINLSGDISDRSVSIRAEQGRKRREGGMRVVEA